MLVRCQVGHRTVLIGAVSYGLQAAAWIRAYRIVRHIWRAYAAQGGQPFW